MNLFVFTIIPAPMFLKLILNSQFCYKLSLLNDSCLVSEINNSTEKVSLQQVLALRTSAGVFPWSHSGALQLVNVQDCCSVP